MHIEGKKNKKETYTLRGTMTRKKQKMHIEGNKTRNK